MKVEDLKIIRLEVDNALQEIAKKYEGKMSIGNMTYETDGNGVSSFWGKVTFKKKDYVDQRFVNRMREMGLKDVNAVIKFEGREYKFVAYKPKARRYPFVYEDLKTEIRYKCGYDYAMQMIESLPMTTTHSGKIEILPRS